MIAALQMYDWPEVQAETDAFWGRIAAALEDRGIAAPTALERPADLSTPWRAPGLVIGQTCGLPYVSGRCGTARLVARPDYGLDDASDGTYCSVLIARADAPGDLPAFVGKVAAVNEWGSQSGCNALADAVLDTGQTLPFFGAVALSGGHRSSAAMVADGRADIAAIDAVSWALFKRAEPDAHAGLKIIGRTRTAPALPYITSAFNAAQLNEMTAALNAACAPDRGAPCIPLRFLPASDSDYDPIRHMADRVRGLPLAPDSLPLGQS